MHVVVFKRPFFSSYTTGLWVRFLRFSLLSHKKLEEDLEKLGLTPPQFYVLATIGYAGGLPFGEIGAKMMVTVSNLTGIVDRLEEKKLVLRKRDENDRRVVHVVLTEKGVKLYKTTIPLFEKSLSRIFPHSKSRNKKSFPLFCANSIEFPGQSSLTRKIHGPAKDHDRLRPQREV